MTDLESEVIRLSELCATQARQIEELQRHVQELILKTNKVNAISRAELPAPHLVVKSDLGKTLREL